MARPPFMAALVLCGVAATQSPIQFVDTTAASGVNFVHTDVSDTMAGGVCLFDYDNDDDPDLFVTARGGTPSQLFRNRGNCVFDDVTTAAGFGRVNEATGAYAADFDNDGWQDLLVIARFDTRLYRNRSDGTFEDVTARSSWSRARWVTSASFADYDGDGDLDIYLGCYVWHGIFPYFDGYPNALLRNDGNFSFVDVSVSAGVVGEERVWDPNLGAFKVTASCTLSVLFFDYDRDGHPDIFVGNDFGPFVIPNQLFRNNGNGTFSEVGASAGFRIAEFNMGLTTADVNLDGIVDLYTSNFGDNHLLVNDGNGRFHDVTAARNALEGTGAGGTLVSWAAMFADIDLDSLQDLWVSNGYIQTPMQNDPIAPSRLLHNLGLAYEIVPDSAAPWDRGVGRGAACGDLDLDGDEDIVQLNNRQPLRLYRNNTPRTNHGATLSLEGTLGNRDAVGALVTIRSAQTATTLEYQRGGSYGSCNAAAITRGIGTDTWITAVDVRWPSGIESTVHGLAADRAHRLIEPKFTLAAPGPFVPLGSEFVYVDVPIRNHSPNIETAVFVARIVMGERYFDLPAYHFPIRPAGGASTIATVYLPIPIAAFPIAQQLGLWLDLGIVDARGAVDQVQMPLR